MGTFSASSMPPSANQGFAGLSPLGETAHPLVQIKNLRKEYTTGRGKLVLFEGLSFDVAQGDLLAIVGQSGAGKSTLLHIIGALDTPSDGDVYCASIPLRTLSTKQAATFRNREIGYVWQFHYLLPEFTALENVAMPLLARGMRKAEACKKTRRGGCRKWNLAIASNTGRASFRAASSRGFHWRAPWSRSRSCCWQTSRQAIWTAEQPIWCLA